MHIGSWLIKLTIQEMIQTLIKGMAGLGFKLTFTYNYLEHNYSAVEFKVGGKTECKSNL